MNRSVSVHVDVPAVLWAIGTLFLLASVWIERRSV
jgi:hypothetical protein